MPTLTLDAAAASQGVTLRTIYRWINTGLPTLNTPHGTLINSDTLTTWRTNHTLARRLDNMTQSTT